MIAGNPIALQPIACQLTPEVPAPVAAFVGSPLSGNVPLTVAFTDESTGSPTSWLWNFGDGVTSTLQNPTHPYEVSGTYTVSLTATNLGGSDTDTKTGYVVAGTAVPAGRPLAENVGQSGGYLVQSEWGRMMGTLYPYSPSSPSIGLGESAHERRRRRKRRMTAVAIAVLLADDDGILG